MTIRIGLVGYGTGGRWFHAPYIRASRNCELVGVVARSQASKDAVRQDDPTLTAVDSLAELIALGVDAVVISTPPETRQALVLEALDAGVAVVADKPFAPSADKAQELVDAARSRGLLLNVFHNRRQDADLVTARTLRDSGRLGELRGLDLRLDLDAPDTLEPGPGGGLLRDLGSHVVDQALVLMGPARAVTAQLGSIELPEGVTNARFAIEIEHVSGAFSRISASKVDHLVSREMRLYGTLGSYVSDYADVQVLAVFDGHMPADNRETWGIEAEERWGVLRTDAGVEKVPSERGDYTRFYDELAEAVEHGGPGPVPAEQGVEVLRVLDAVVVSDSQARTVVLTGPTA
ncbi:Gfo/Idh/MocA family oxidoreductase [Corynebacterium pacaense]|uniref:Gfo/Idh/MocA family oxidoreductase n=1 Tax=Corynebacterium pacaense TaxID=1816684 RepID=UPI0009BBF4DE|nr:Gfo/Idh/MocA family oxidoreductase [Corynebacterium pacaense]